MAQGLCDRRLRRAIGVFTSITAFVTPVFAGAASRAADSRAADMRRWIGLIEKIEEFARAEGCSATRIMGRKGWARVLASYRTKRIVLEKDL